jgi:hypothetical protein
VKIFKLLTSALVVGLIFLFIKQNITAFTTTIRFGLDLFIREPVSWSHEVYGLMIMSGLAGFVAGFAVLLRPYLNMRRMLVQSHHETEAGKSVPVPEDQQPLKQEQKGSSQE